jgi:hypothetical protein
VQSITPDLWTVSGLPVAVDQGILIEPGIAVGDVVQVAGQISAESTWTARSIRRIASDGGAFEFIGVVASLDPWIVNGVELATANWTDIDEGIEVGDRVKVEGRILPGGTWLAEEIKPWDEDEPLRFEFVVG